MIQLPPAVPKACNDCPWRRNAAPGWLGPLSAAEWGQLAHSEEPVACHQTLPPEGTLGLSPAESWAKEGIRQCRGMAVFRVNIFKSPRNPTDAEHAIDEPDTKAIFGSVEEFVDYHGGPERALQCIACGSISTVRPFEAWDDAEASDCAVCGMEDGAWTRLVITPCPLPLIPGLCKDDAHHHGRNRHETEQEI